MKNKNGYTLIELLILIVVLGVVMLFTLPNLSHAFNNNKEELYESDINLYLNQAKLYGEMNKEEIKNNSPYIISIKELVDKGYIGALNGEVNDVRDGSSLLTTKIKIYYSDEDDSIRTELF